MTTTNARLNAEPKEARVMRDARQEAKRINRPGAGFNVYYEVKGVNRDCYFTLDYAFKIGRDGSLNKMSSKPYRTLHINPDALVRAIKSALLG